MYIIIQLSSSYKFSYIRSNYDYIIIYVHKMKSCYRWLLIFVIQWKKIFKKSKVGRVPVSAYMDMWPYIYMYIYKYIGVRTHRKYKCIHIYVWIWQIRVMVGYHGILLRTAIASFYIYSWKMSNLSCLMQAHKAGGFTYTLKFVILITWKSRARAQSKDFFMMNALHVHSWFFQVLLCHVVPYIVRICVWVPSEHFLILRATRNVLKRI